MVFRPFSSERTRSLGSPLYDFDLRRFEQHLFALFDHTPFTIAPLLGSAGLACGKLAGGLRELGTRTDGCHQQSPSPTAMF